MQFLPAKIGAVPTLFPSIHRGRPAHTAMPLFWKPYKSDISKLIDELKAERPTLEAEQLAGRARFWDRPIDRQAAAEFREDRVPQQAYVYQPKTD